MVLPKIKKELTLAQQTHKKSPVRIVLQGFAFNGETD